MIERIQRDIFKRIFGMNPFQPVKIEKKPIARKVLERRRIRRDERLCFVLFLAIGLVPVLFQISNLKSQILLLLPFLTSIW